MPKIHIIFLLPCRNHKLVLRSPAKYTIVHHSPPPPSCGKMSIFCKNYNRISITEAYVSIKGGVKIILKSLHRSPPPNNRHMTTPPCFAKTLDQISYSSYIVCQRPWCRFPSGGCCLVCCSSLWQIFASNEEPGTEPSDDVTRLR